MARQHGAIRMDRWLPEWRRESLRTNLWLLPTVLTGAVVLLFVATYAIDRAVYRGALTLPVWMDQGSADAGRQVLSAIAAGVITVAGVVFSVTIVVLTLASQQFGPRMLRNLIRDVGTQVSLGAYVATFVYTVLALGSITSVGARPFVPHLSITVCLFLLIVDIGVLIYFIHHIAVTIQLPQVMAGISADLHKAIDLHFPVDGAVPPDEGKGQMEDIRRELPGDGAVIVARRSGYLQFVDRERLVALAAANDCVVELLYRPGHFVTTGLPMARIWPSSSAARASAALERLHVSGSQRTLAQDPVFAVDQLVEIAIRALSPAVNDTFTALTCIDWLSDSLCVITGRHVPEPVYRDRAGVVRVLEPRASYARIVNRANDKVRQAGRGMPAVLIRQIDGLGKVMVTARSRAQVRVLLRQADMIWRAGMSDIAEPEDRRDLQRRYDDLTRRFGLPEAHLSD